MLCHGKPICGKKSKDMLTEGGNESEGEDMYGFLPKPKPNLPRSSLIERTGRVQNIYETRKPAKVVTFKNEPHQVRIIQRRHSCAENFRDYQPSSCRSARTVAITNRTPSYPPAIKRSTSFAEPCAHYHRRPLPLLPPPQQQLMPERPPPPCYNIAIRRAASFSASRGVNRGYPRRPPPFVGGPEMPKLLPMPPLFAQMHHSSSTSDLYVDSFSLKRAQSREILSAASSTSSISEATVYRKIGPGDYVSVSDKQSNRKSFRCENDDAQDCSIGPLIYVPPVCFEFWFFMVRFFGWTRFLIYFWKGIRKRNLCRGFFDFTQK